MSTAIGKQLMHLIGCRVGGTIDLVLPYFDATGKFIDAKAIVSAYINGKRRRDGSEGRRDLYRVTAWGPLAWTLALTAAPGKELHIFGEPRMYKGRAFDTNRNVVMWEGQPLMINKFGITVEDIRFGADSANQIQKEIGIYQTNPQDLGGRPPHWNVPGSQDEQIFKARCRERLALQWDGQSQNFGFARIISPQAQGCRVLTAQEIHVLRTQGRRAITGGNGGGASAPAQSGGFNASPAPANSSGFAGPAPSNPPAGPANQAPATPGTVAAAFGSPAPQGSPPNGSAPAFTAPAAQPQAGFAGPSF